MTPELTPFIDALHDIAYDAGRVLLKLADPDVARRGVAHYNAIGLRLLDRFPAVASVYRPLPVEASPGSLRLAARDVAAFISDLPDPHYLQRIDTMPTTQATNEAIATALDQVADRLTEREENPHRVQAYRYAAQTIRHTERPLTDVLAAEGLDGLRALPGIGESLASRIAGFIETGRLQLLERIRNEFSPKALFTRVPGIGPELAQRIYDELGIDTLEDLEIAAHDGRLTRIEGFGPRRVRAIRAQLHAILSRQSRRRALRRHGPTLDAPPVAMLLHVDREYRYRSQAGELRQIAPRRFNPDGAAWLPILNTHRDAWRFTALFSNTARAHELDKTNDWVVIYAEREGQELQFTVVTETRGALQGKRVVRGREAECRAFYEQHQRHAA